MRVVILGGGVVGVTTAYQLQKDGHEVVVLERQPVVANETSWGNAGMVAPGHSFVWSSPSAPKILLKSLFMKNQALKFKLSSDWQQYRWSWLFLKECTAEKARKNTLLKHRLCVYSQSVLAEVNQELAIDYDRNQRGIIFFHRDPKSLETGISNMRLLESDGQEIKILDRQGLVELEPALASAQDKIAGAIYCPTDEAGDSAKFSRALAQKVIDEGGEIKANTTINRIVVENGKVKCIDTSQGQVTGDLYILSAGSYSPLLSKPIGIYMPVYPAKGYSLTVPIEDNPEPPSIAAIDEHNLMAITPLGDRIRVTAIAEFDGYNTSHKPSDFTYMKQVLKELYPKGANFEKSEMWAGLRPMTPSNLPIISKSRYNNLMINTGHGHIGWTMSHGSARIVADMVAGKEPAIPMEGLSL